MASTKTFLYLAVFSVVLPALPKVACSAGIEITHFTKPSKDVKFSFIYSGRIAEVKVKEGNLVKAGQILVQQDDAVEQANLEQLKAQSEDTTQIEANKAKWKQKEVELKKFIEAQKLGAATELELENARLEALIAKLSLRMAKFQHEQDQRKYTEAKLRVDRMKLKSPITGWVEEIHVEPGESVQALADVIRVVRIDPLWIDVPVGLYKARKLKLGQRVKINFPDTAQKDAKGKIIFIAKHADAGSETSRVRIEMPNKSNRPAGEQVVVFFSDSAK